MVFVLCVCRLMTGVVKEVDMEVFGVLTRCLHVQIVNRSVERPLVKYLAKILSETDVTFDADTK